MKEKITDGVYMKKRFLDSGKIVGTHGIKGELRIDPWCDSPEFLCCFKKLYLDEQGRESIKVKSRPHKNIVLCKVDGIDTIEQADKMRGKTIYIDREEIVLDEGVNFVQDLLGLEVKDADNATVYGKITDVLRTGANDVYVVQDAQGKELLLPAIHQCILDVDIEKNIMTVHLMKGLV